MNNGKGDDNENVCEYGAGCVMRGSVCVKEKHMAEEGMAESRDGGRHGAGVS